MTIFEDIVKENLKHVMGKIKKEIASNSEPYWNHFLVDFLTDLNELTTRYNKEFDKIKEKVKNVIRC